MVLNFSDKAMEYAIPGGLTPTELLMTNLGSTEANTSTLHLKGWESRVYRY